MIYQEYIYKAKVFDVYDGDTFKAELDLGFGITSEKTFRLYGIDAPEVRGLSKKKGIESRDTLRKLIMDKEVLIETIKDKTGKYGRYLAKIYVDHCGDQIMVNDYMVKMGFAKLARY